MKYPVLLLFLLCGLHSAAKAQTSSQNPLAVTEDPRISQVIAARIEFNKKLAASPQGFRILIYSGSQRQEAYAAQGKFKTDYPDMTTYLSFAFPNFKVMAGDFKTKDEAQTVINELQKTFTDPGLLIIPQKIDLTKYKEIDVNP